MFTALMLVLVVTAAYSWVNLLIERDEEREEDSLTSRL